MSPSWASYYTIAGVLSLAPSQACGLWTEDQFSMFVSYFKEANVRSLNIYACSVQDAQRLAKLFTKQSTISLKLHDLNGRKDLIAEPTHYVQGVIIDFSCCNTTNIDWINLMLHSGFTWLIYVDTWSDVDKLADTRINLMSDVVVAICTDGICRLYEASRARRTHPLSFSEFGIWENNNLKLGNKRNKHDLAGIKIVGGIVIGGFENVTGEPPNFEDRSVYPGKDQFTRFHVVLYRHLELLLNYKLEIVRSATYGYPLPNGSFDGLVGDLLNEKIDIGITSIEPRPGRVKVVNFLQSYWKIRMIFMLRQPRALGSFSALAQPLSSEVWASVFVFAILFSVCYEVIQHLSSSEKNRASYYEGLVLVVGALSQQGLSADVNNTSSRMLCFFLLFLCLVLMTYYNAAIMNALLLPSPVSIRTLEQLIAPTSPVQPGLLNITYLVDNRSSYMYVKPNTVNAVKRTPNGIMDLKSGIKRVAQSNFAFCAEESILYDEVLRTFDDGQKCDLSYIELLKPFGLSSPIARTSPFKEVVARGLIYLQENGLVDREKRHWNTQKPQCFGSISFFYVSLEAVGISFTIFLTGVVVSLIIFWKLSCDQKFQK
ncbi:hypothetical protein GE061_016745 [Apolygus lucorum]|uniref:Ionotropic glutamate receptor C-terminal domain-containing protein n=1 Tax=Apolygus lucorum TaxID=248454 RepID=A0A8S9XJ40_APOLU|nr:hypothetical protein GE061_016745 [Apolygus lucorum]